jgi:hypothetical protein
MDNNNNNEIEKKLLMNLSATRNSLVECGYKLAVIDIENNYVQVETVYNEKKTININNNNGNDDNDNDNDNDGGDNDDNDEDDNSNDDDDDNSDDDDDDDGSDNDENAKRRRKRRKVSSSVDLSGPTYTMGKNLNRLLKCLNKLSCPAPTWNSEFSNNPKLYNEALLKKLESSSLDEEESRPEISSFDEKFFLRISPANDLSLRSKKLISTSGSATSTAGSLAFILNNDDDLPEEDDDDVEVAVISEGNLMKLSSNDFNTKMEEVIQILASKILRIYDKTLKAYVMEEISRRSKLRYYISILTLYQKLEGYCQLNERRNRGQTVKHQAIKKIVKYSKTSYNSPPNFFLTNLNF